MVNDGMDSQWSFNPLVLIKRILLKLNLDISGSGPTHMYYSLLARYKEFHILITHIK